jgi:glycine cleavage system transcriptional repressor
LEVELKTQLLVTATGEDRPGIVARLTELFVKHGANLEESRMALLGGEFAAIMLVSLPEAKIAPLNHTLAALSSESIVVTTKATKPIDPERFRGYVPCRLTVSGADHEGIVHTVSSYLLSRSINIQDMESDVVYAPITGTPLFAMKATVQVPPAIAVSDLRRSLSEIGDKESVEIQVHMPAV